jgi:protein TonB
MVPSLSLRDPPDMIKSLPTNSLLPRGNGQCPSEDFNLLDFREPVQRNGQATHWAMIFALIALHGGLIAYLVGFTRIANPSGAETVTRAIPVEIVSSRRHDTLPKEDLEIRHEARLALAARTLADVAEDERVPKSAFPLITRSVKLAQARIGVLPEDGGRVAEAPPESEAEAKGREKEAEPPADQEPARQTPLAGQTEQASGPEPQASKPTELLQTVAEPLPEDGSLAVGSQNRETRLPEDNQPSDTESADDSGSVGSPDPVEWLQAREIVQDSTPADVPSKSLKPDKTASTPPAPPSLEITKTGPADNTDKRSNVPSFIPAPPESPMPSDRATDDARKFRTAEPLVPSPQLQEAADRYGQILASQEDIRWPEDVGKADASGPTASVKPETASGSYKPGPAIMRGDQEREPSLPLEAPLPERRTVYAHEIASHEARGQAASKPRKTASAKPRTSRRALLDNYRGEIRNHLASYRPPGGFGADTVVVGFALTRSGKVASARILKSRGIYHLEQGTLNAVHRAAPFPLPPGDLSGNRFHFAIPFRFE